MTDNPVPSEVDFMSLLTHQLSAPLTTMRWYVDILQKGQMTTPLDAEQSKIMDEVATAVTNMGNLLDDIRESSWLERDKYSDEPTVTSIAELVTAVQTQQQPIIADKKLEFSVEVDPSTPSINARPSTLTSIVKNLITNATKYTPEGGSVRVVARPATSDEAARLTRKGQECVLLSVADTGCGIPAAQQDQVFKRLFRADNAQLAGVEGTGLGSYIVFLATKKLGGDVWFTSAENEGSTFYVVIPVKTAPTPARS